MTPTAELQQAVASHFGVTLGDLLGPRRPRGLTLARHVAMLIIRDRFRWSYPEIGRAFDRDHSSVLVAVRRLRQRVQTDKDLRDVVAGLTPPAVVAQPVYVPPYADFQQPGLLQ